MSLKGVAVCRFISDFILCEGIVRETHRCSIA